MLRLFAYIILNRLLKTNDPIVKINIVQITTLVTLENVLVDFLLFMMSPSLKKNFKIIILHFSKLRNQPKKLLKNTKKSFRVDIANSIVKTC